LYIYEWLIKYSGLSSLFQFPWTGIVSEKTGYLTEIWRTIQLSIPAKRISFFYKNVTISFLLR
jgi:hypothetical protein